MTLEEICQQLWYDLQIAGRRIGHLCRAVRQRLWLSLKSISKSSASTLASLPGMLRFSKTSASTGETPKVPSARTDGLPTPLGTGRLAQSADIPFRYDIGEGRLFVSGGARVQETDFDFAGMEIRALSTMSPEEQAEAPYRG